MCVNACYIYTYISVYVYIYIYTHTCVYIYIYTSIYLSLSLSLYIYIYIHTLIYTCYSDSWPRVGLYMYVCVHARMMSVRTLTQVCALVCTRARLWGTGNTSIEG